MLRLLPRPDCNVDDLATEFAERGFVQVRQVFDPEVAERLLDCLQNEVPWGLAYYEEGARFLRKQELTATSPNELRSLERRILQRARQGYQYAYNSYPILDAYLQRWNEVALLSEFLEALNGEPLLEFVRTLTGFTDIRKADAQATRFGPGQFLRRHHDQSPPGEVWRVAYVYNLTRDWEPDWGGLLQLLDAQGDVARGLVPRFNALNLIRVPQPHLVSQVSSFAGGMRYAVTGWFRSQ